MSRRCSCAFEYEQQNVLKPCVFSESNAQCALRTARPNIMVVGETPCTFLYKRTNYSGFKEGIV